MIVEDEYGNDVIIERDADREPEEPDMWDGPEPLDLDELGAAYARFGEESCVLGEAGMAVTDAVPQLLDMVRDLMAELGRWRSLPSSGECAITTDGKPPGESTLTLPVPADVDPLKYAQSAGVTAWTRTVYAGPWHNVSEPPF